MRKKKTEEVAEVESEVLGDPIEQDFVDPAEVAMEEAIAEETGEDGPIECLNMNEDHHDQAEGPDDTVSDESPEECEPEFNENGQAVIPGTDEDEDEEERRPRSKDDIKTDFRMATFSGSIKKITEDWNAGRKLNIAIESGDRIRIAAGLNRFSSDDHLIFRVLPHQPKFNDREPEEFGTKVPSFGVAMIERLERKSIEGRAGWQTMDPFELLKHMSETMSEFHLLASETAEITDDLKVMYSLKSSEIEKLAVDLANYAFFMWYNSKVLSCRNKGGY